jgi:hypothetical protein
MPRITVACLAVFICSSILNEPSLSAAGKKAAIKPDPAGGKVEHVLRSEGDEPIDRRARLTDILQDHPDSSSARWQAGFVRVGETWQSAEEPVLAPAQDVLIREYHEKRARTPQTPAGQLDLADWCRKKKLVDQEQAHLRASIDLAPEADHTAILERLGNTQFGNVWLSREQVEQWQAQNRRTQAALKHWGPRLEKLADRLDGSRKQHDTAVSNLKQLTDLDVIPVMECTLCGRDEPCAAAAVEVFGKMEGYEATLALAKQAAFSDWPAVREQATNQLKGRRFEDFVPPLIGLLATPVTKKISPSRWYYLDSTPDYRGARGQFVIISGYILARETNDQFQVAVMHQIDFRLTEALQGNFVRFRGGFHLEPETGGSTLRYQPNVAAQLNGARAGNDASRLAADQAYEKEKLVEAVNARTDELNSRVIGVLASVTDRDANPDPANWWKWWGDFTDTQLAGSKGTVMVAESTEYIGDPYLRIRRRSCFAAGTPVWTESGPVPIEKIQIGDRILAQNIESGELTYKTVQCTTIRPAKPLVRLQIGEESIIATGGHRFWAVGEGWTKARDLAPKSLVHTVTGTALVRSVETGPTAETYNLVVADFHDYFVGRSGFLVQDLPMPQPTNAIVPGLGRPIASAPPKK